VIRSNESEVSLFEATFDLLFASRLRMLRAPNPLRYEDVGLAEPVGVGNHLDDYKPFWSFVSSL
jgi:hypothetical protein